MSKKYSKYHSNYILNQPHKKTKNGLILQRDWTTIGEIERFERGKIPVYGHGNFKFTVRHSNINPTKHTVGKWVGHYTYEDVKNAKTNNNLIDLNLYTNDIRDFAYYGSAVELIKSSIQHILSTIPAQIKLSSNYIDRYVYHDEYGNEVKPIDVVNCEDLTQLKKVLVNDFGFKNKYFLLQNDFYIDLHHEDIILEDNKFYYRYLTKSFKDFIISNDRVNFNPITKYTVKLVFNELKTQVDIEREKFNCIFDNCCVAEIIIVDSKNTVYNIYGYLSKGNIQWVYKGDYICIRPKKEILDDYLENVSGFEKIILSKNTKPMYYCRLITPMIFNDKVHITERGYYLPNEEGFLDLSDPSYLSYVNNLYDIGAIWDSICTDNLSQRMTHEAIKNYDWTYTKDYDNGDEEEFVDGGLRIEKLLHIYGRLFDDIKVYIDGIKHTIKNTYDGYNNIPTSLLTDVLEECGWNVVNTIPILNVTNENYDETPYEFNDVNLDDEFLSKDRVDSCVQNEEDTWFKNCNSNKFSVVNNNINFMRKLILNSHTLFSSKGTRKSIDMIMGLFGFGGNDYQIDELYYTTTPKLIDNDINEDNIIKLVNCFEGYLNEDIRYGVPLKKVEYNNKEYYIPCINNDDNADIDLYFQSNGGWVKYSDVDDKLYNYTETLSDLKVKGNVSDLFTVAPINVKKGDLFYVSYLNQHLEFFDKTVKSHYYCVVEPNLVYCAQGWKNVSMDDEDYKLRIEHYENIVITNIGNNPHIGYGRYDSGNYYIEHLQNPFKFALDTCTSNYGEDEFFLNENERNELIDKFKFNFTESNFEVENNNSKVFIVNNNDLGKKYYINSKVVKLTNNLKSNKYFSAFFKDVILQYIMQVIPSTTILILKDF